MRPLLIDDKVKADLKELAEYAEKNVYSMDDLLDIMNGATDPPGLDKNFTRTIPYEYRVVFTIEDQVKGKFRHLSISVGDRTKLPNPHACEEIIKLLGFESEIYECLINVSEEEGAINILEKING